MKVLVTGADGFVGSRLVPRLLAEAHDVIAAVRPAEGGRPVDRRARTLPLDVRDPASVRAVAEARPEAVIHLAAVASGGDARKDPALAWEVNAVGTARLAEVLAVHGPRFLLVSTSEVYGAGPATPRVETDPPAPCSPYGASKLGAEVAALEVYRRTGLPVTVARAFAHTGAGQDTRYVVPAFAARLRAARRSGAREIPVGNLTPVREFLHVDDVVDAYLALLDRGRPGQVYNVASGRGLSLAELFERIRDLVGHRAEPRVDPALARTADIPYLVGSSAALQRETGWAPRRTLDETLAEVVHAQAD